MTLSDVAEMRLDCPMCNAEDQAFNINLEDQTVHCPDCDGCESISDFRDRINAYANWEAVLNWLEGKDRKDPSLPPPLCLSRRDLAILATIVRHTAGSSEGLSNMVESFLRTDSQLMFELPNREAASVRMPTIDEIDGLDKLLCQMLADMIAPGKI